MKSCFVISPIGDSGSPSRLRADQIFKYVIEPVLGSEWKIERADKISEPGIITNQIIERLVNCDLVIADLSERNPNVFYELAVRHISKKPYVHLIAHDEDIPFDNAPVRAIKIDVRDLDSVDFAKKELGQQVANAMSDGASIESPITVSLSLYELRKSGDQEGVVLQSVLEEVASLRRQISNMSSLVSTVLSSGLTARDNFPSALSGLNAFNPGDSSRSATRGIAGALSAAPAYSALDTVDEIARALSDGTSSSKPRKAKF